MGNGLDRSSQSISEASRRWVLPLPQICLIAHCRFMMALKPEAIPHNSKCRYGERGAAVAKPKAQIILDAAKVSAASGGNSEPKQGQRSQSARGFCPRSTMRVPQPDIIEHFGNADAVPQPPKRCLSRKAGIVRCCPTQMVTLPQTQNSAAFVETGDGFGFSGAPLKEESIF